MILIPKKWLAGKKLGGSKAKKPGEPGKACNINVWQGGCMNWNKEQEWTFKILNLIKNSKSYFECRKRETSQLQPHWHPLPKKAVQHGSLRSGSKPPIHSNRTPIPAPWSICFPQPLERWTHSHPFIPHLPRRRQTHGYSEPFSSRISATSSNLSQTAKFWGVGRGW